MNDDGARDRKTRLEALAAKLEAKRLKRQQKMSQTMDKKTASALGLAWRMSTEIVATLVVGGLLGYGADQLIGSGPWGLLVGLILGFAAGLRNIMRLTARLQEQYDKASRRPD
jgi:ATP synthase protein I